jgi:hypothetical protein
MRRRDGRGNIASKIEANTTDGTFVEAAALDTSERDLVTNTREPSYKPSKRKLRSS